MAGVFLVSRIPAHSPLLISTQQNVEMDYRTVESSGQTNWQYSSGTSVRRINFTKHTHCNGIRSSTIRQQTTFPHLACASQDWSRIPTLHGNDTSTASIAVVFHFPRLWLNHATKQCPKNRNPLLDVSGEPPEPSH